MCALPPIYNSGTLALWRDQSADRKLAVLVHSRSLLPNPTATMGKVIDFMAGLARAGKDFSEIEDTVKKSFGDKSVNRATIYRIMKSVKNGKNTDNQCKFNATKIKRNQSLIAVVATAVEEDRQVIIVDLAGAHGVSHGTIFNIIHDNLGLVKKSSVPKLFSAEQKLERVRISTSFVAAVCCQSLAMLNQIVTMDETLVSYPTPLTKKQSKQWISKGQLGPIKVKVQANRTRQMA